MTLTQAHNTLAWNLRTNSSYAWKDIVSQPYLRIPVRRQKGRRREEEEATQENPVGLKMMVENKGNGKRCDYIVSMGWGAELQKMCMSG